MVGEMQAGQGDERKYIIGWLKLKPGKRGELMALAPAYAKMCREEVGCLFFEMNPSVDDADVVVVAECFKSVVAHEAHLETPWFQKLWAELDRIGVTGRFENIVGGRVDVDTADFGG